MNIFDEILIVDDDLVILQIHKILLQKFFQYKSLNTFINGHTCLEYIDQQVKSEKYHKHLIFLDINMPVMNGWELLEHLQKYDSQITFFVVIVSSSTSRIDKNKSESYPQVIDYIEKPMTFNHLHILNNKLELLSEIPESCLNS